MKRERLEKLARVWLEDEETKAKRQNVVAIISDKQGKVIVIGENTYTKTCPVQKELAIATDNPHKEYLHAEVTALARFNRFANFQPYQIFVARMDKSGNLCNAKPCPICALAIQEAGIKKVAHT